MFPVCLLVELSNTVFESMQRFIKNVQIASQHIKRHSDIRLILNISTYVAKYILNISTYVAKPLEFPFALDVISARFSCPHTVYGPHSFGFLYRQKRNGSSGTGRVGRLAKRKAMLCLIEKSLNEESSSSSFDSTQKSETVRSVNKRAA